MTKDLKSNEQLSAELLPSGSSPEQSSLLPKNMSRRMFGKLVGSQALLVSAASAVTLSGCGGGGGDDPAPTTPAVDPGTQTLTRAAFVATISDYFDWAHSSEYVDQFKSVQQTFADVSLGDTAYAKQIETALEENLISNVQGYFSPDASITREDAADIYVKAFKVPAATSNPLTAFTDANTISAARLNNVKAMVEAGYMSGTSATTFAPKGTLSANEAKAILTKITTSLVAPVQAMPKPGTTSPRRYVSYTTPTPGAQIYITETFDGSEPPDPTVASMAYDFVKMGTRNYVVNDGRPGSLGVVPPGGTIRTKAVAMKNGMAVSAVQSFSWTLNRPGSDIKEPAQKQTQPFEYKLVHQATATAPAVYKIFNMSESVQAYSFLILGPDRGVVFDFIQVHYLSGDMKPIVDKLANGKPYDAILGHNHVDHVAQIGNFSSIASDGSGGVAAKGGKIYTSKLDKYQLMGTLATANAGYKAAGDQAVELTDGQVFDLGGGIKVTAWFAPGHEDGLVTLVTSNGWVYASDMWACNRPYTADTTGYSGVRSDLMLSLVRQLLANYKKSTTDGLIIEVTNAHQEAPVKMEGVNNFVKCFQKMIDQGPSATEGSIRGGINRMSMVHNDVSNVKGMWRDKNWMALEVGANPTAHKDFTTFTEGTNNVMTSTGLAYPCNNTINYNTADGYKKYSVLANLEVVGGTLEGKDVYWNVAQVAGNVERKLTNKFDPWSYAYTINVPAASNSITVTPWAMSSKFTSMKLNGAAVTQGASVSVAVSAGSRITVDIVAADGVTSSTYTFTVAKV